MHSEHESPPPLPPAPPPPPRHDAIEANMVLLQIEREREERIARILKMEKELTYLRSHRDEPELSLTHHDLALDKNAPEGRYSPPEPSQDYYEQAYPTSRAEERRAAYLERHGRRPTSPTFTEPNKERRSYQNYPSHRQHEASSSSSYKEAGHYHRQLTSQSIPSAQSAIGRVSAGYSSSPRGRVTLGKPSVPVGPPLRHPNWQSPEKAGYKPQHYSTSSTYWN